tara:strand:- start:27196 stop:27507 length:312 start_codon:yes stop_codon:yes gene_type:complete
MKPSGEYTQENFVRYHRDNPHIWEGFIKYTMQVASKRDYFSAKAVFHRMRWDTAIGEDGADYKLNDGWISHYARKFMDEFPQYEGFFQTRSRKYSYFNEGEES